MSFVDSVPATFDLWIVGDKFLGEIKHELMNLQDGHGKDNNSVPLYMQEFFNVKVFQHGKNSAPSAIGRTCQCVDGSC